jgi:hypothetical protein
MDFMEQKWTYGLWGAAGGALAVAIVGLWSGMLVTNIKSEIMANQRAEAAIVTAFTPICVDKFRAAPDADAKLTELMKVNSWSKAIFVKDGGWAMVGKEPNYRVADACADILAKKP